MVDLLELSLVHAIQVASTWMDNPLKSLKLFANNRQAFGHQRQKQLLPPVLVLLTLSPVKCWYFFRRGFVSNAFISV